MAANLRLERRSYGTGSNHKRLLMMASLDQARTGQRLRIDRIDGPPELVQRLMELGLMDGETIEMVGFAPLGDPLEILVGDARLSIRKREAASITVTPL